MRSPLRTSPLASTARLPIVLMHCAPPRRPRPRRPRLRALLLALIIWALPDMVLAEPPVPVPGASVATAPSAFLESPSRGDFGWAAFRLAVGCVAVGVLLFAALALYRRAFQPGAAASRRRGAGWLARWVPAGTRDEDRITLLARSYLGTRESVCVMRVGDERFLIGVTTGQISMLGRLGEHPAPVPPPATPSAPDFSQLMAAAAARETGGDTELRAALARSRARLAQLVGGRGPGA